MKDVRCFLAAMALAAWALGVHAAASTFDTESARPVAEDPKIDRDFSGNPDERLEQLRNWLRKRDAERKGQELNDAPPNEDRFNDDDEHPAPAWEVLEDHDSDFTPAYRNGRVRHVYYRGRRYQGHVHSGKHAHFHAGDGGKHRRGSASRRGRASAARATFGHRAKPLRSARRRHR